jgi:hypothetical protein
VTAPKAEFDHLVVAGVTLAQAIEWFADLTGVAARAGGQHVRMGTHNALAKLGERAFVELIAIDPSLPKPARPRWFDLEIAKLALTLGEQPRLIHWVARTTDLDGLLARAKHEAGTRCPWRAGFPVAHHRARRRPSPGRRRAADAHPVGRAEASRPTACPMPAWRSSNSRRRIPSPRRSGRRSRRSASARRCA